MGSFLNNNSAAIMLVLLVAVLGYFSWTYRSNFKVVIGLTLLSVILGGGFLSARYGPSDLATIAEVDTVLGQRSPVVLQIYSDSCTLCLISKGRVDELSTRLDGEVAVLRLDIGETVGKAAARRYEVRSVPTFIIFSPGGQERFRQSGFPDIDRLETEALSSA